MKPINLLPHSTMIQVTEVTIKKVWLVDSAYDSDFVLNWASYYNERQSKKIWAHVSIYFQIA